MKVLLMQKCLMFFNILFFTASLYCSNQEKQEWEHVKKLCETIIVELGPLALAVETIQAANHETTAARLAAFSLQTALETTNKGFKKIEEEAKKIVNQKYTC